MKYFACFLFAVLSVVSSAAAPSGALASDENAVPEWSRRGYRCGCMRLRGGHRFRDFDDDDDDSRIGRFAAGFLARGGNPLWAVGGRGPMGGQFVAGGHGAQFVAGGVAPRGIQWTASGSLPHHGHVAGNNADTPVVVAPVDDAKPRHLTDDQLEYESDEFR
jgi:hypothetical protein